jgi:MFS family permease
MGEQYALLQSIGIGITNLVFTFIGLYLIDKLGRRTLLLIGTVGYIVTLLTCAFGFWSETYAIVPWAIFGFIGSHAIGQGAVIWVFLAEIFPTKYRSKGQGLGSFAHWINAAMISTFFPELVDATSPQFAFFLFAVFMMLALVWVIVFVPETKGVPLEAIGQLLGFDPAEEEKEDDTAKDDDDDDDSDEDNNHEPEIFQDEELELGILQSRSAGGGAGISLNGTSHHSHPRSSTPSSSMEENSLEVHHAHVA